MERAAMDVRSRTPADAARSQQEELRFALEAQIREKQERERREKEQERLAALGLGGGPPS